MFIKLNDINMYYEKYGNGKDLIMVHGNGEDSTIFNKSVEILKNYFTVYVLDLRDHGQSSKVETLHYEYHVMDLYNFINELNLDKPIFYGFSDGGIIGLMLAYKYPDLLSKLIVSGVNINPKGLKKFVRFGMWINYLFTRSKKVRMMLKEPNITLNDLKKIKVDTYITMGSNDVIYKEHIQMINDNINKCQLDIFKGHNHSDYIVNSEIIGKYIKKLINRNIYSV